MRHPHLQRLLNARARARTGARVGRTGEDVNALMALGYPQPHDIGPACRPRYAGPYPFEGLEGCAPYGPSPDCRDYALPLSSLVDVPAAGAAGNPATVTQTPQVPFVGKRLVVASAIAEFFVIETLIVGKNPQFVQTGDIPAQAFSEVGVGVALAIDPAYPGVTISVRVRNIDAEPHPFLAVLIGNAVE